MYILRLPSYLVARVYILRRLEYFALYFCTCRERVEPKSKMIELHVENVPIFFLTKETLDHYWDNWNTVGPDLNRNVVAITQPVGVENNAIFIDLKYLKHTKDIMCDELGSWNTMDVIAFGLLLMLMESQKHGGTGIARNGL